MTRRWDQEDPDPSELPDCPYCIALGCRRCLPDSNHWAAEFAGAVRQAREIREAS